MFMEMSNNPTKIRNKNNYNKLFKIDVKYWFNNTYNEAIDKKFSTSIK